MWRGESVKRSRDKKKEGRKEEMSVCWLSADVDFGLSERLV